jgi:hypothetical protein
LPSHQCAAGSSESSVETRNISPAPSASLAVMIGVLTQKKPLLVEEAMDRLRDRVAQRASPQPKDVGARAQVRDFAQELHRVRLRLDRVGLRVVDPADTRCTCARPGSRTAWPFALRQQFVFNNPQAAAACGCGESFTTAA